MNEPLYNLQKSKSIIMMREPKSSAVQQIARVHSVPDFTAYVRMRQPFKPSWLHSSYYRHQGDWDTFDDYWYYRYYTAGRRQRYSEFNPSYDFAQPGYYRRALDPHYQHSTVAPWKSWVPNFWDRCMDYTSPYFPTYTDKRTRRFCYRFN